MLITGQTDPIKLICTIKGGFVPTLTYKLIRPKNTDKMEAVTRRKSLNIVLNATKNVAVLYTIGFFLSLTGALTFLGAQIANAMTSGKF